MAERWQQWMPFHIDRFRGSPDVQAMHPIARMGYLYLLASAWQTGDCTLPDDPFDLANLSGLGDELWTQHSPRILRKFIPRDGGRLQNEVLLVMWEEARRVYEARSNAAKDTTAKRFSKRAESVTGTNDDGDQTVSERRPLRSADTITGTGTATGTETKAETFAVAGGPVTGADLERVYLAYPRHVSKAKALEAIRKAVASLGTGENWPRLVPAEALKFLHEKVTRYAQSPSGNAGKFTPHAATWFNQAKYLDDEREWQRGGNSADQPRGINRGQERIDSALEALRRADAADADTQMAGDSWNGKARGNGRCGAAGLLEGA